MNYSEKLKDPRWQRLRLEVMQRDSFSCRACRRDDLTLNVHHLRYYKDCAPWDYGMGDLITLCEPCHETETKQRKNSEKWLLNVLNATGWLWQDIDRLSDMIMQRQVSPQVTRQEPTTRGDYINERGDYIERPD